jgi:hypothetical protein
VQSNWLAARDDTGGSARSSADALRRAEDRGHPVYIQMAVVTAASSVLFQPASPDFTAGWAILAGHDEPVHLDAAIWIWLDIIWGMALVGLHRQEAIGRLARAIRLADRQSALNAEDLALRLLAVAVAEAGHEGEADMLTGYSEANLRVHRFYAPGLTCVEASLDSALAGAPDRPTRQAAGAGLSRHEMLAIVNDCEAITDDM